MTYQASQSTRPRIELTCQVKQPPWPFWYLQTKQTDRTRQCWTTTIVHSHGCVTKIWLTAFILMCLSTRGGCVTSVTEVRCNLFSNFFFPPKTKKKENNFQLVPLCYKRETDRSVSIDVYWTEDTWNKFSCIRWGQIWWTLRYILTTKKTISID